MILKDLVTHEKQCPERAFKCPVYRCGQLVTASAYDRPLPSASRHSSDYDRPPVNTPSRTPSAYDRPGPSHDRREEPPSRMSSVSSTGSNGKPRSYAEYKAMKAAMSQQK